MSTLDENLTCLGLELTDRCDLQCTHCLRQIVAPNSVRARDIPFELIQSLVAQAKTLGIRHVGLTGGEPMLHPRFLDIIDCIVDAGLNWHFLSNGLGLPAFIPQLLARPARLATLRDVCISMDGATAATHDAVRGEGTFHRTLAGLAVLRAHRLPFVLLNTVHRVNRHEIDQMGLFAHHLGATRLVLCHFMPNGRPGATANLDLNTAERHEVEFVIKRLMSAMKFEIMMAEGYYAPVDHLCSTVQLRSLNVDPAGHLTFCCELSNYNGDTRPPESRDDFLCDLRTTPLTDAVALLKNAIASFRDARLADAAAGLHTEDDRFACRYCVKKFGKPEREVVKIRRRSAAV